MPAMEIPTIDVSPYLKDPDSPEAAEVVAAVRKACESVAFFSIVGHGIPKEVQENVFAASKRLFDMPFEEKLRLKSPVMLSRGYDAMGQQVLEPGTLPDQKEGFYVGKQLPSSDYKVQKWPSFFGSNVFPEDVPDTLIRQPVEEYYEAVLGLAKRVLEILAKGLPYGDDVFKDFVANDPICNLRLLHYPPHTSTDPRQRGAGAHTDFGAITLLLQDTSGGLEVLDYATGQYVPVDPNPDAYVVNIGDMMQMWTKGVYKSTMHRVINKGSGDRYSVPFFFDGNAEVKLNPLDGSPSPKGDAPTVLEHMAERFGTTYGPFVDEKPKANDTSKSVVMDQPTTNGIAMQPQDVSVGG